MEKLKVKVNSLKKESYVLYLVYKDTRVPLWKRFFLAIVIGYAFCPIDLIPDFIPILGYLDDIILVPIGISFALRLIPDEILAECRKKVAENEEKEVPVGKKTAITIVLLWIIGAIIAFSWIVSLYKTYVTH